MTEQEAIAVLKRDDDSMRKGYFCINDFIAIEVSIKALEEVQKYRAIGTPEECLAAVEKQKKLKSTDTYGFVAIGKTVEQFEQEIRYKAIDDFAEGCKQDVMCQTFGLHPRNIDKIVEQLKGGGMSG